MNIWGRCTVYIISFISIKLNKHAVYTGKRKPFTWAIIKLQGKTHLGHHLSQSMNFRQEFKLNLQQIMQTWCKLSTFWRAASFSVAWKSKCMMLQSKASFGMDWRTCMSVGVCRRKSMHSSSKGCGGFRLEPTFINCNNT